MKNIAVTIVCALALVACGGGGGNGQESNSASTLAPVSPTAANTEVVAAPTAAPTAAPPVARTAAPLSVMSDDFGPASPGWLPKESFPNQDVNTRGYENGEYVMRRRSAPPGESGAQLVEGFFVDVSFSVDARLAGDEAGRYISMKCRAGNNGVTYYRMNVDVATQVVAIQKFANQVTTNFGQGSRATVPSLKTSGQVNRLQFSCIGNTLSGSVNGAQVVSVQDDAFKFGGLQLGVGTRNPDLAAEVHFDNLSVDIPARKLDAPSGDHLRVERIGIDATVSVHVIGPDGQQIRAPDSKPDDVYLEDFSVNWAGKYGGLPGTANTVMNGKRDDGTNACMGGQLSPPCPGVFANLALLRDGDAVGLFWKGQPYTYTVVSRCLKPTRSSNWDAVYASTKSEILMLTSSTGQFDAATRSYSDILTVYAERTASSIPKECPAGMTAAG
jgi:hypothetical protein